ncbi:MAG TPA: hypothetical protein VK769_04485 [Verrucomicrobiae bacterium]|jgi:hypothetical protein|nr:hypothetical protein [Verrucomicrobiae bacterium]
MKSSTTSDFWRNYRVLPPAARTAARKAYKLWQQNPRHGSLQFQKKGSYWCARIGPGYRALGREHEGTFYWFWIGPHDEYERLLRDL